ncbi:MAG: YicC/YloC family endoribonuclease [Bacteroidota bacterium]|nr:YicC/YloC family endoribonuclease [Bacteroidota bacterium]
MIKSMTGFGKFTKEFKDKTITVEVRSLNSKGADISLRLSSMFRAYELDLRNELTKQLERGKIDLSVFVESKAEDTPIEINIPLAKAYHTKFKELATALGENNADLLKEVIKMPDVMKNERKEADENVWKEIMGCINEAIKELNKFRDQEGKSIEADFKTRLGVISDSLTKILELDKNRLTKIKERIKNNLADVIGMDKIDSNRFEQELIYYIEKLDINEEKVRLKQHLDYFLSTMKENSIGRKLNFITQEIGREINTIGSKANDADMQKLVVLMKDELEKLKEQSSNVL